MKIEIEQIEEYGYRIGVPIPFPMKYVYCYLLKDKDHFVLIDVGLNYPPAREMWEGVFRELNIQPTDIKTIYLTHFHPDHSGLCGWMQEKTGANVLMSETDKKMIERVWGEGSVQTVQLKEMIIDYGVPEQLSAAIIDHMEKLTKHVLPLPRISSISSEVEINGNNWEVIHTPGHSAGHICFYQEVDKILIAGDHVLDKITPNISVWPGSSQDPLHEYMDSLRKIKSLSTKRVYSAHGKVVEDLAGRVDELIAHHEFRLAKMEELADSRTAYEIAEHLFAHKELSPHQWRFAIAETIAHLHYLEKENRIKRKETTPIVYERQVKKV
ncbi:MBL fold metallo-hydrolase [Halalkalibacter krulwichiae]|uniref:Hydroxyacylglutathione hydrolase n=1 Tax=Halalkalibacter krulwichiae TaxID=199441 RepID=A0A1X9MEP0_9BACI|nr:MBL fold metallo-hydrolase [Halalkalibacter krulwichiae]ARK28902.1 hydroxyacylglutathione hydrolase [Halalkalibacter krulwichiae]